MNKSYLLIGIIFLFQACDESKKTEVSSEEEINGKVELNEEIVGTWTNLAMNVTMKNEEADSIIDVPEGSWEEVLGIKPIVTEIKEDGTFISTYYTLEDEVMMTSAGSWKVSGDTLTMTQDGISTAYHTSIEDDVATFTGYLDWDQDAEADDLYTGTQRKQEVN